MREVFVTNYSEDTTCGEGLATILTKPRERDSDLLQAQAIDILAQSNLMLSVRTMNRRFPLMDSGLQPSAFRRYPHRFLRPEVSAKTSSTTPDCGLQVPFGKRDQG